MTEKRFKMKKLEYEVYFIDSQQEYVDEDEPNFKIDGERTLSNSQILDLLNENEKLKNKLKFFNGLNEPYGTIIKENERLKKENERLKKENKDLEFFRYNVFKSMDKARIWREKKLKARKNS